MFQKFLSTVSFMLSIGSLLTADIVYVTNSSDNTVSVIDTSTNQVSLITHSSFNKPSGIAITPDGSLVFVGNLTNTLVSIIDTTTNTVTETVDLGMNSRGIAISPDGTLAYVASLISNQVSVISIPSLSVSSITDISTFSSPSIPIFSPDGTTAYVTNQTGGTHHTGSVSIIDVASSTVTGIVTDESIPTFRNPNGIAITPDGSTIYVSNENATTLSVVTTSTNPASVITTVPGVGPLPAVVAITPDGAACYVANQTPGTVSKISTSSNHVIGTIPVGPEPIGVAISVDQTVYVANSNHGGSGTVSSFPTDSLVVTETYSVGNGPFEIAILSSSAPSSLTGCMQKNVFLTQTDLVNVLTWNAPISGQPANYNIYRDAALTDFAGSVHGNGPLQYLDHNRTKGQTYTYYVVSVYQNGGQSQPAIVTVTQSCPKNQK